MGTIEQPPATHSIPFGEAVGELRKTRIFANANLDALKGIDRVDRLHVPAGIVITETGDPASFYWVVLQGETRAERLEADGSRTVVGGAGSGDGFGEAPILSGKSHMTFRVTAIEDTLLVRFKVEQFWQILAGCPEARAVVLADMAQRLQAYQVEALHREKLISLGTLAAGLMHELHNPGSAAKRAASQLRTNLLRLQELSLRSSSKAKSEVQLKCMHDLLEHAVQSCHAPALSSLDQADAEEAMSEWLQ